MGKVMAEYIWIDGHKPTAKLRSKTKILEKKLMMYQNFQNGVLMVQVQGKLRVILVIVC